jgi:hypothetical protein
MPLPQGFQEFEHLQDIYRKTINQIVREEFSDVDWADDNPDLTTSRSNLKWGCTHKDDDSGVMTQMRTDLFYMVLRKAADLHPPVYGIPSIDFQELVRFHPQITLFFTQDQDSVPDDLTPIRAQITFRLMNETPQTMTEAKARSLGNEIKNTFGVSGGYRWRKGKYDCSYTDQSKGYYMQLHAYSESEGREVIQKVLSLNEHVLDDSRLKISPPVGSTAEVTGTQLVYGEQRRKPRRKPVGYVRFRYAQMDLHGLPESIVLIDRTGFYKKALVRA